MKSDRPFFLSVFIPRWQVLLVCVLFLSAALSRAHADDDTIIITPDLSGLTAGTLPGVKGGTGDANDIITITFDDKSTQRVTVPVPAGTKKNSDKSDLIIAALTNAGFVASATTLGDVKLSKIKPADPKTGTPAKKISGPKQISILKASGETDTMAFLGVVPGTSATVAYAGPLSGVYVNGTPAVYTSGFGYDGFSAQANLTFTGLSTPTISGLLSDTYNVLETQLPLSLQSSLSLDLVNQNITFYFPNSASNPFVLGGTSDSSATASISIGSVPEPGSVPLLAGLGVSGIGFLARRRRHCTAA